MITFISGKPNSGKSLKAEELAMSFDGPRFYVATMKIMDDDGRKRVEKHRKQREGKGFITIECEYGIDRVIPLIRDLTGTGISNEITGDGEKAPVRAAVLLECIANLVGNELYDNPDRPWSKDPSGVDRDEFRRLILKDIKSLAGSVSDLIIVSSRYESEASDDPMTGLYLSLLNALNIDIQSEIKYNDFVAENG